MGFQSVFILTEFSSCPDRLGRSTVTIITEDLSSAYQARRFLPKIGSREQKIICVDEWTRTFARITFSNPSGIPNSINCMYHEHMSTTSNNRPSQRMQCMEIWGGNRAVDKSFEAPGLDLYVFSVPFQGSKTGGGDIYYCTSCASGRITRLLLADVSGHGESASKLAITLRDLLRENVNTISQSYFIEGMNREFGNVAEEGFFATAVVATYFEPKRRFTFGLAGHPYPIYYRAAKKVWVHLDPQELADDQIGNLPLGILENATYTGRSISTQRGDMFLLYSDAFIEAVDRNGSQLGIAGLLRLLNQNQQPQPAEIIPYLRAEIQAMSISNLEDDDATIFLGHFTANKVRMRDNFLAAFRLLGKVRNNTNIDTTN